MSVEFTISCDDEQAMQVLGSRLVSTLSPGTVLTLAGELGAGKSFLARAMIHSAGYVGRVKSPTYTLIETYDIEAPTTQCHKIAHMDLYRLADPDELHYLGFDDVLDNYDLVMIEWPVRAGRQLPEVAVSVCIEYGESEQGRVVTVVSKLPLAGLDQEL